jgi:hypothetical protein
VRRTAARPWPARPRAPRRREGAQSWGSREDGPAETSAASAISAIDECRPRRAARRRRRRLPCASPLPLPSTVAGGVGSIAGAPNRHRAARGPPTTQAVAPLLTDSAAHEPDGCSRRVPGSGASDRRCAAAALHQLVQHRLISCTMSPVASMTWMNCVRGFKLGSGSRCRRRWALGGGTPMDQVCISVRTLRAFLLQGKADHSAKASSRTGSARSKPPAGARQSLPSLVPRSSTTGASGSPPTTVGSSRLPAHGCGSVRTGSPVAAA